MPFLLKNATLKNMKKGLLVILSGPSGVGKGTVRQELMKDSSLHLWYSVSMTTRAMRPGEENGREYYFVTPEEFQKTLKEGGLLEHNHYVDHDYGTPKAKVEEMRQKGYNVLLEIDVNGAEQVMAALGKENVCSIFLLPPSFEELARRIKGRCTECDKVIAERLEQAKREIAKQSDYRYHVVNQDLLTCAKTIATIIRNESAKD